MARGHQFSELKDQSKLKFVRCTLCSRTNCYSVYERLPFRVLRCHDCGMGFLDPLPSEKFLDSFYSQGYFESKLGESGYKNYFKMKNFLDAESVRRLDYITKFVRPPASLVDVGAGLGFFAAKAQLKGFKVSVIDRSPWAVRFVKKTSRIPAYVSDLTSVATPTKKFQVVTAWDSLEHLRKPADGFLSMNRLLEDGGWVFITTPNIDSADARFLGKRWYGFKKIPEHLQYFSPSTIKRFAHDAGFRTVGIHTWGFVRNFEFIADKVKLYNKFLSDVLNKLTRLTRTDQLNFYFPIIDMIVVLKKEESL